MGLDQKLCADLDKKAKKMELEVLVKAVGPPTLKEVQYKPLCWLHQHPKLNSSYSDPTYENTSLLMLACQLNFSDVVHQLLRRGANVQHTNDSGSSALHVVCKEGHWDCVRPLLENKANPNDAESDPLLVLATNLPEETLLPTVRMLLEFKADPNLPGTQGQTALMRTAAKNEGTACRALIKARADPNMRDDVGRTARIFAATEGHSSLANFLQSQA